MKFNSPAIVFFCLLIGIGFVAFYSYRQLRTAAMKSCVYSLEEPIREHFSRMRIGSETGTEWTYLSPEISQPLVAEFVQAGRTDCGTFDTMSSGKDYWSNPIKIAVLNLGGDQAVRVRVSSDGPDGITHSDDDIVIESVRPGGHN